MRMLRLVLAGWLCLASAAWAQVGQIPSWPPLQHFTSGGALSCSYTPVTTGTQSVAYTGATPSASGGTPSYTFSETGTLPGGLSISSSTGVISGTPSASGSFTSIQVKVTDSTSTVANCGSAFTLVISPSGGGCSQATAYLAGQTTTHTADYTTLICGLVTDGTFALLDRLYVHAADNTTLALRDIITATNATLTGTGTFTAFTGYVPVANGTVNTALNISTATNYKQNSALLFAWTNSGATNDNNCPVGSADPSFDVFLTPFGFSGDTNGILNGGAGFSGTTTDGTGLFAAERPTTGGATSVVVYKNGTTTGTTTSTSSTISNTTLQGWECSGSGSSFTENIAVFGAGGALGATNQLALYNRLHTFLHAVNATTFP